jgi:excisionase family DNA binding protein
MPLSSGQLPEREVSPTAAHGPHRTARGPIRHVSPLLGGCPVSRLAVTHAEHPSLADLVADSARLVQVAPETVPRLLGDLERLRAELIIRLVSPVTPKPQTDTEPLLTVPEVAELLQVPESRVYELARSGKLPSVRLGKYVRVEAGALRAWIAAHSRHEGLDVAISATYSPGRDRCRTSTHSPRTRAHASGSRRVGRRGGEQHCSTGAGGDGHTRAVSAVAQALSEPAGEQADQTT